MRPWHYIRGNKTSSVPERHIFVDTETERIPVGADTWRHKLKLGWACYVRTSAKNDIIKEDWRYFTTTEQFWDWLESKCHDKKKVLIWAHNIGFDFAVVEGFRILNERGWDLKKWIQDAQRVLITYRRNNATIQILDTLNYFKASLKQIGDDIGIPKGKIDFATCSLSELSDYCRNDVAIIRKAVLSLVDFIRHEDLGTFKPTIAGQAFTAFKHRFMDHKILVHNRVPAINLERAAYRGGRTECFYIGKVEGKAYNLDVNSMYPYVMMREQYPTQLAGYNENVELSYLKYLMRHYLVLARVKVKVEEPAIGIKKKRLIFPLGDFEAVLTSPELEWVLDHGEISEIKELAWYESAPIFEKYVNYMYTKRQEAKQKSNKSDMIFYKYLLNTLYGKFGQRNQNWQEIGEEANDGKEYVEDFYDLEKEAWRMIYHFGGKIWEREGFAEGYDSFVAIPAFVTAYARMYLWQLIKEAGYGENVYYCDTDSLFVNQAGYDRLSIFMDDTKLGFLKLEAKGALKINNVKDYVFKNKRKIKGVKTAAKELSNGVYKQNQFVKFRGAMHNGSINNVLEKEVTKHFAHNYNKGVVQADGWVNPFFLRNSLSSEEIVATEVKRQKRVDVAMRAIDRTERVRGRQLMKTDIYDEDSLLNREEKIEDALREAKRWILP